MIPFFCVCLGARHMGRSVFWPAGVLRRGGGCRPERRRDGRERGCISSALSATSWPSHAHTHRYNAHTHTHTEPHGTTQTHRHTDTQTYTHTRTHAHTHDADYSVLGDDTGQQSPTQERERGAGRGERGEGSVFFCPFCLGSITVLCFIPGCKAWRLLVLFTRTPHCHPYFLWILLLARRPVRGERVWGIAPCSKPGRVLEAVVSAQRTAFLSHLYIVFFAIVCVQASQALHVAVFLL